MDIRIDNPRFSIIAPQSAPVLFRSGPRGGVGAGGPVNCSSEVFNSAPPPPINAVFSQYVPHPSNQSQHQAQPSQQPPPNCVNCSQPPPPGVGFNPNNFYSNNAPPPPPPQQQQQSNNFNHQQRQSSTPKKNRNYENNSFQRGPPNFKQQQQLPPFSTSGNILSNLNQQTTYRRCNSMSGISTNNFMMANQPLPPPVFGQQPPPPQQQQLQQLPHRGAGGNRGHTHSSSRHHKRYVSGGGVTKSKKSYDRKNDNNSSGYRVKLSNDKHRSHGYYEAAKQQQQQHQHSNKRKWIRYSSNDKSKRFRKRMKWTECTSFDIARVHRDCAQKGQPLAPYNTTQFIMNQHMAEKEIDFDESNCQIQHHRRLSEGSDYDDIEEYSSPAEDENQFLDRQFHEAIEQFHLETLHNKSKEELLNEYISLEKKFSNMNKSQSGSGSSVVSLSHNQHGVRMARAKIQENRELRKCLRHVYMLYSNMKRTIATTASSAQQQQQQQRSPSKSKIIAAADPHISSTSASDCEMISSPGFNASNYQLSEDMVYMIEHHLRDSDTDDSDDSDDTSVSSSSCDSDDSADYSSDSDSSYSSDDVDNYVHRDVAKLVLELVTIVDENLSSQI